MTAIASTERSASGNSAPAETVGGSVRAGELRGPGTIVESTAEQTWAEFCSTLEEPAFLLAITGFADL